LREASNSSKKKKKIRTYSLNKGEKILIMGVYVVLDETMDMTKRVILVQAEVKNVHKII